jgi:hypothetical protein
MDDALSVDERDAGNRDFESPIEDLDHGYSAGLKDILIDNSTGDLRKLRLSPASFANWFSLFLR